VIQPTAQPTHHPRSLFSLPGRIAERYRETAVERPDEDINTRVLLSFLGTFCAVRIITHGIRNEWLPLGNIVLGGKKKEGQPLHIHHMVWGILSLTGCGYVALLQTGLPWRKRLAPVYGAAVALTYDEFALWLHLQDDYWTKQGRDSVDAVVLLSALFGLASASPLFWRRALDEVTHTAVPGAPVASVAGKSRLGGAPHRKTGGNPHA
jgi:hypothetical protein